MTLGTPTGVVGSIAHAAQVTELLSGRPHAEVVAVLNPEPFHGADSHAVAVHVQGEMVGHLERDDADADLGAINEAITRHGLATVQRPAAAGRRTPVGRDRTDRVEHSQQRGRRAG